MSDGDRAVRRRYADPLDMVWTALVDTLGLRVRRTDAAFATYDGAGTVALGTPETLDADDCVAQMVLHELCHALVQGRRGLETLDWALACDAGEESEESLLAEYAAQRLQAYFADSVGMRGFFAVTTQWRDYWDRLGAHPLRDEDDPATAPARRGFEHARAWGWEVPIRRALDRTAAIAAIVAPTIASLHGDADDDDDHGAGAGSLWLGAMGRHPATGFAYAERDDDGTRCGDCAWAAAADPEAGECGRLVCIQTERDAVTVADDARACVRYEPRFDGGECGHCGACCREGFDAVEVAPDEPLAARDDIVAHSASGTYIPRPGGRCRLLTGDGAGGGLFRCRMYAQRPRSCRDFEVASMNCLLARRRVNLSY